MGLIILVFFLSFVFRDWKVSLILISIWRKLESPFSSLNWIPANPFLPSTNAFELLFFSLPEMTTMRHQRAWDDRRGGQPEAFETRQLLWRDPPCTLPFSPLLVVVALVENIFSSISTCLRCWRPSLNEWIWALWAKENQDTPLDLILRVHGRRWSWSFTHLFWAFGTP